MFLHENEPYEEVSDFMQSTVPHSVARPRFEFLGVSGYFVSLSVMLN